MTKPAAQPTAIARLRRRHHRVSSALWYFRGEIDDYRQQPGWDPLSPEREQRLVRLLRWARQLTSRVPRTSGTWPSGQPVSADLALRLVRAALRDLYSTAAGKPCLSLGYPRRHYPNQAERLRAQRAAEQAAHAKEDAAMWAEYEREEAGEVVEEE